MRYFWVKIWRDRAKTKPGDWTVGRYLKTYPDVQKSRMPWEFIASDDIFAWDDIAELGFEIYNPYVINAEPAEPISKED